MDGVSLCLNHHYNHVAGLVLDPIRSLFELEPYGMTTISGRGSTVGNVLICAHMMIPKGRRRGLVGGSSRGIAR